jgi:hypothetical protein
MLSSTGSGCCFETDNYSAIPSSVTPTPTPGVGLPGLALILASGGLLSCLCCDPRGGLLLCHCINWGIREALPAVLVLAKDTARGWKFRTKHK